MQFEDLERFNPWWKTGQVRAGLLKEFRRKTYFEITKYLDKKQIILIWGLRRVGKTTLMLQLISDLLTKTNPKNVLYFSFDEIAFDLKNVLESYQKIILNRTFDETRESIYIFLDEIQKIPDWENKLKTYYDLYPNIKFFTSGSASVALRKKSSESLAGRVLDFLLKPLSFPEFLEMNGKDVTKIKENPDIWKREILPLFYRYMKYGMFPELVNEDDEEFARKYILNNIIERIIYKDLPGEFEIKDVELLKNLIYLLGKNPGMIVNFREISKNLGKDQRTIANYFEYLEFGLLIRFVFNYRGSPMASLRKMKKVYLSTPNIAFAFNQDMDRIFPFLLENIIATQTDAKFFYRNGFEIDFVIPDNDKLIAIEVKKTEKDIKQIRKFREEFKGRIKKAIIIDLEKEGVVEDIEIIPAWKFLLN
ncbi:MAG: Archaeal ATPase [Candidatus Methanoperedens nitroreducens]|uniref:Archaeal ATPase n=1 Tax=Candidatus Methanoperedens nitratireducens TaxID=1392998 RepID=A0A0P8ADG9_9EURY|nr:ATP-binding protein [Candidatus Methanoperedens sp. BLZ2]KAB2947775.1 MAG: ATP-binding protein [Candidatus Methanoperedens sp.]KPQ44893.1 MAG: Archaeal ATPase [Candidatus Methanoperedens sp. BLZ1]MBZ0176158.1 ATP-binding protein [Candidatus Methanoperedens nitroreducens]MCX9077384.1 ATP-binding protein [Candidatus Methanoperedens sp.]